MSHPPDPRSLRDAAYQRLRADIVTCRLAPGQWLTERGLSLDTGYGISPIRDALTRLDQDGLIRTVPRKGYQVTPLTLKRVDDLFLVWKIICPELARSAAVHATAENVALALDKVRASQAPPGELTPREAAARWVEHAQELFAGLAAMTGNAYLVDIYDRLSSDISRVWVLLAETAFAQGLPVNTADAWTDVLTRRDGESAARYTRDYIVASHAEAMEILARWPSVLASELQPVVPVGQERVETPRTTAPGAV